MDLLGPEVQRSWWSELRQRVQAHKAVPFVGAGVSRDVYGTWQGVLDGLPGAEALDGPQRTALATNRGQLLFAEILALFLKEGLQREVTAFMRARRTDCKKALPQEIHKLLLSGPWPGIVTTNWDDLLDEAWREIQHNGNNAAAHDDLPIRGRREVRRFLAELRAGLRPLPVLHLHGRIRHPHGDHPADDEFVFGHGEYRRVTHREIEGRAIVTHLATEYSLLFLGTSLTDPDLLHILDSVREVFGEASGPHYWIHGAEPVEVTVDGTPQKVDLTSLESLAHVLLKAYGIRLLRIEWNERDERIRALVEQQVSTAASTASVTVPLPKGRLHVHGGTLPYQSLRADGVHVVASVGVTSDGRVYRGGRTLREAMDRTSEGIAHMTIEPGTAVLLKGDTWLACGQERAGYGRTRRVRDATRDAIERAGDAGARAVHLPLIASGRHSLHPRESFHAMVWAAARTAAARGGVDEVHIYTNDRRDAKDAPITLHDVMTSVLRGRIDLAQIVERASADEVLLRVVHPDPDGPGYMLSQVTLPAKSTVATLFDRLGLSAATRAGIARIRRPAGWSLVFARVPAETAAGCNLRFDDETPIADVDGTDGALLVCET